VYTGLSSSKVKEIEGKVLQHCRDYVSPAIAVQFSETDNPGNETTKILVFIAVASQRARHMPTEMEKSQVITSESAKKHGKQKMVF
jgi:hypothetical protein